MTVVKHHHHFLAVIIALSLLFYPGAHYLYSFEFLNPDAFAYPVPLFIPSAPIPLVKAQSLDPRVSAQGVYVVELKTFTPVFTKNPDEKRYPASTTKMITALTTIRTQPLDRIITVREATEEGQIMGLVPGERMTVENLLYGILVHSANDAAYALAESSGSFDAFIKEMNSTAQSVGMRQSTFTNPAGLDEVMQQSTPHDLALAARAVLRDKTLRHMVSVKSITVLDEDYRYTHELTNVNELLGEVEGLGGIKTGSTEAAGQNLVSYFKTPYTNHEYIIVVMQSEDRFRDTKALTDWITFNIEYVEPDTP